MLSTSFGSLAKALCACRLSAWVLCAQDAVPLATLGCLRIWNERQQFVVHSFCWFGLVRVLGIKCYPLGTCSLVCSVGGLGVECVVTLETDLSSGAKLQIRINDFSALGLAEKILAASFSSQHGLYQGYWFWFENCCVSCIQCTITFCLKTPHP